MITEHDQLETTRHVAPVPRVLEVLLDDCVERTDDPLGGTAILAEGATAVGSADLAQLDESERAARGRDILRLLETCPFEEGDIPPLSVALRDIEDEDGIPITDDTS